MNKDQMKIILNFEKREYLEMLLRTGTPMQKVRAVNVLLSDFIDNKYDEIFNKVDAVDYDQVKIADIQRGVDMTPELTATVSRLYKDGHRNIKVTVPKIITSEAPEESKTPAIGTSFIDSAFDGILKT